MTRLRHSDPAFFGRTRALRFDAPAAAFGVCYLGTSLACCFLEVFRLARRGLTDRLAITTAQLADYYAAIARSLRPLRLAFLADDGLVLLGIDQRVTGGDDYALSGRWANAIYRHAAQVDGIFYATRHHNGLYAVALFERAREAVECTRWGGLGDRGVADLWVETNAILERFQIDVIEELPDAGSTVQGRHLGASTGSDLS